MVALCNEYNLLFASFSILLSVVPDTSVKSGYFYDLILFFASFTFLELQNKRRVILLALVAGLVSIERFTLLTGVVPFIISGIVNKNKWSRYILIVGSGAIIFTGTWVLRNFYHTGHIQLTSGVYRYLWVGSLEETCGTNYMDSDSNYYGLLDKYKITLQDKTLDQQSLLYKTAWIEKCKTDFAGIAILFLIKCKTFWWFPEHAGSQYPTGLHQYFFLYKWGYGVVLLIALAGVFVTRKRAFIWILFPVSLCIIQALFYVEVRHRMPAEFITWYFAFIGLQFLLKHKALIFKKQSITVV